MTSTGKGLLAAGLLAIAVAVAVFAARFESDAGGNLSPVLGSPVPDLSLPRLDGDGTVNLPTLASNHDLVVVNFFASWCLQCRNEHPDLVSTAAAYQDRSVRFVGVTFQDRPDRAISFLDELGWGTAIQYTTDPGSQAAIALGVFGVPETIFLSEGEIVGKLLGETKALTLSGTIERILSGEAVGTRQVGESRTGPADPG